MEFFVMERRGMILSSADTPNQCKDIGHRSYEYYAKLVFHPTTQLDSSSFLVDHAVVDSIIQDSSRKGSCEQMHNSIMDGLRNDHRLESVIAIKVTIIPVYPAGMANLTKIYVPSPNFLKYLSV